MNRRALITGSIIGALAVGVLSLPAQPRLKTKARTSYQVGDIVDGDTMLYSSDLAAHKLADLIKPESRVVVLFLFGAAAPSAPQNHPLRGGVWCPDSFDEFPLLRAIMRQFRTSPVQVIPVAVPPAYSDGFGFIKDVFVSRPDGDALLSEQSKLFIELTEGLRDTHVLPFGEVYYDPKYRLADDPRRRPIDGSFGTVYDWQGKFRWHEDPRKYGTPSIWLLSGRLEVLREPFTGNTYNASPPEIRYGFFEVKDAIEVFLK